MKVINLFGGPGSGKSTVAAGIFYKMKMQHESIELVTEYAKDLLYSDFLDQMMENQEVIFAEQNFRTQRLLDKGVDWVVTDSPIVLSAVYARINLYGGNATNQWKAYHSFVAFVHDQVSCYENINIFLARPPSSTYQETGRAHTLNEAQNIDAQIRDMLFNSNYPYEIFNASETVVDEIITHIKGLE